MNYDSKLKYCDLLFLEPCEIYILTTTAYNWYILDGEKNIYCTRLPHDYIKQII